MKLQIMAMRDAKIGEFMTPFFAQSIGAAMRAVGDMVNGSGNETPAVHPEDFSLYCLGSFNTVDGTWFVEQPQLVAECANLKTEKH